MDGQLFVVKRGVNIRKSKHSSFVLCKDCDKCIRSNIRPTKAIANGFFFGSPPKELTELRECELAMVATVKSFAALLLLEVATASLKELQDILK